MEELVKLINYHTRSIKLLDNKYYLVSVNQESLLLRKSRRLSMVKYWHLMKYKDLDYPVFSISKVGSDKPTHKYFVIIKRQAYLLPGPGRELPLVFLNGRFRDVSNIRK